MSLLFLVFNLLYIGNHSILNDQVIIYYDELWRISEKGASSITYLRECTVAKDNDGVYFFEGPVKDYYYPSMQPQMTGAYTMGIKNGEFAFYYESGQLEKKGLFRDGQKDGVWEFYYPNGKPMQTVDYSNSSLSVLRYYSLDGKQQIVDGTGDWTMEKREHNYVKLINGKFVDGKMHGEWKCTFKPQDGKETLIYSEKYKDGQFVGGKVYSLAMGTEKTGIENMDKYNPESEKFLATDSFKANSRKLGGKGVIAFYQKEEEADNPYESEEIQAEGDTQAEMLSALSPINYPVKARREGIEGAVKVWFVVEPDGKIYEIKVIKGIGGGCDEEAVRYYKQTTWTAATKGGKPIRQEKTMDVNFNLK